MRSAIILIGPTGAGKSQQAELLARGMGFVVIGTGRLLRQMGDKDLTALLDQGVLASTELVQQLVQQELFRLPRGQGVILDGFPRNLAEATWLAENNVSLQTQVATALELEVSRATAQRRILARGRSDDSRDALAQKFEVYQRQIKPVIEYYRQSNLLHSVDGNGTPGEVAEHIMKAIKDAHLV